MNWSRMRWQKEVMNFWQQKLKLWFWIVKSLKLYDQRLLKQHAIFLINSQCQLLRTTRSQFSYCLNFLIRIDQQTSSILDIFDVLNAQHMYIFQRRSKWQKLNLNPKAIRKFLLNIKKEINIEYSFLKRKRQTEWLEQEMYSLMKIHQSMMLKLQSQFLESSDLTLLM